MKRIVLTILIIFALYGCGDEKVNNNNLVVGWGNNTVYQNQYDSKFKDYNDYSLERCERVKQFYQMVEQILILKSSDNRTNHAEINKIIDDLITDDKSIDCIRIK